MALVTKPYDFNPHPPNSRIDSAQMDANFDTLYDEFNGKIDSANIKAGGVATGSLADGAVTPAKLFTVPAARVHRTANYSVSLNVPIPFDRERFDTDAMHDGTTNPARLTFNTPGKYLVVAQVQFSTAGAFATIKHNGATSIAQLYIANGNAPATLSTVYDMAAGDYVELVSSVSTTLVASPNAHPEFTAIWMG